MKGTFRRILGLGGAVVLICQYALESVAADPGGWEPGSPVLSIYNWESYIVPSLLAKFEAANKVRVDHRTFGSNDELTRSLVREPGRFDVIIPTNYHVAFLRSLGMLSELDKTNIPNLRNLDVQFMSPTHDPGGRHCVTYLWSKLVVGYDSRKVRKPIRSWADIFDPRYRGRVALLADARETLGIVLLLLGHSPNSTDVFELGQARDFLIAHASQIHSFSPDGGDRLLEAGEVDIALEWDGDMAALQARRPEFRRVVPSQGSLIASDSMCIPRASRNKALAERFINFILEPENGALLASKLRYPTPNLAAQALLPEPIRASLSMSDRLRRRMFPLEDIGTSAESHFAEAWAAVLAHRQAPGALAQ
ncbi:MAG: spermidine/putrescine ABC transporter substrate-binding protein [Betaproteobacteria bacterium]